MGRIRENGPKESTNLKKLSLKAENLIKTRTAEILEQLS
jgi:hypothetical protein